MQEAKVVQVAVKEWIFVVPFHLDADAVLEVVDLVRRGVLRAVPRLVWRYLGGMID
jgi:hypothetical protein